VRCHRTFGCGHERPPGAAKAANSDEREGAKQEVSSFGGLEMRGFFKYATWQRHSPGLARSNASALLRVALIRTGVLRIWEGRWHVCTADARWASLESVRNARSYVDEKECSPPVKLKFFVQQSSSWSELAGPLRELLRSVRTLESGSVFPGSEGRAGLGSLRMSRLGLGASTT